LIVSPDSFLYREKSIYGFLTERRSFFVGNGKREIRFIDAHPESFSVIHFYREKKIIYEEL
jgi:hypothetical protein